MTALHRAIKYQFSGKLNRGILQVLFYIFTVTSSHTEAGLSLQGQARVSGRYATVGAALQHGCPCCGRLCSLHHCQHTGGAAAVVPAARRPRSSSWPAPHRTTPCLATKRKHQAGSLPPRGGGRSGQRHWATPPPRAMPQGQDSPLALVAPGTAPNSNAFLMHRNTLFPCF